MVTPKRDPEHRPRRKVWATPSEVEPDAGVARQVEFMRRLIESQISAPEFAKVWLAARRRALNDGERVREDFDRVLTNVFYLLDDYVIDPVLRDTEDMTDAELVGRVREALHALDALDEKRIGREV